MSAGYFGERKRIGEVWICQNCGTEFPEYHNGCPKSRCDDAPKRGLVCVPIYEDTPLTPPSPAI